jgi:gluconolactonase
MYDLEDVTTFVTGLDHPECVAVGRDGTLYAGGEAGQVYRISSDGRSTELIASTQGRCLGVTLDADENIIVCDPGRRAVVKVTQQGGVSIVADRVGDRTLTCPNFSVFDADGNLYFSDSGVWKKGNGFVCRMRPGGPVEMFAEGPFHFANGIALDAPEEYLYVVESNRDRVVRITIRPDGSAGPAEVFADGIARIPDGLAFDAAGNLYVTTYASNAIYRVDPDGQVTLVCIDDECAVLCQATNCAFSGENFDELLVANLGAGHISKLKLGVKGQPLFHQRASALRS